MTLNKFSSTKTILVALLLNLITLVFAQDNSTRVIHIASPSAGDVYQAGSHLFVSWSIYPTSGFITAINLYRGDPRKKQQESQLIAIIATDVEAMKGSFNWMIPDALPTAKDCKLLLLF